MSDTRIYEWKAHEENMKKIAFIICHNNEQYMKECINYISWLKVPKGVEKEIITISEAKSLAAGYNAAMHDSDAKYKVYLHQDVFIINENFIPDVMEIFEQNPEYGMLGVLGSTGMIPDANYLLNWDVGITYLDDSLRQGIHEKRNPEQLQEVEAVDGMIMITQYDVEWRKDIFDSFDFYDVSQSMEFKKAGYKVGVPCQKDIWCNHMCGHSKLEQYDLYREKFCMEYRQEGYCFTRDAEIAEEIVKNKELQKSIPIMEEALEAGEWGRMNILVENAMKFYPYNTQLCNLFVINKVIHTEIGQNIENGFYVKGSSALALLEKYLWYKFLLKRLEYNKPIEDMDFLLQDIIESTSKDLSTEKIIAEHAVANTVRVILKLKWNVQRLSGKVCEVRFDKKIPEVPKKEDCCKVREVCISLQNVIEKLEKAKQGMAMEETLQYAGLILETIEDIVRETHLGTAEENLYMTYFEGIERRDISIFLQFCEEWLKGTINYFEKIETEK